MLWQQLTRMPMSSLTSIISLSVTWAPSCFYDIRSASLRLLYLLLLYTNTRVPSFRMNSRGRPVTFNYVYHPCFHVRPFSACKCSNQLNSDTLVFPCLHSSLLSLSEKLNSQIKRYIKTLNSGAIYIVIKQHTYNNRFNSKVAVCLYTSDTLSTVEQSTLIQ